MKISVFLIISFLISTSACNDEKMILNVMSFNIRYDTPNDGENYWPFRKDFATNMIRYYEVDILGTQEVTFRQLNDMLEALPEYSYVGVARDDGKTSGEYSAVLYRKDRFKVLDSNTFWLSEDPSAIGVKGWDAAITRVVTWAILKDNKTGKRLAVFNTHFDHRGSLARIESARLLVSEVEKIAGDLPVIITGDFNATPDSEVITILTDNNNNIALSDTRSLAEVTYGPDWTYHGFGQTSLENRRIIDFVFVNPKVSVKSHAIISETLNNTYLSDHNPVLVKLIPD